MVLHEQALLFAAGILWEQASGGRRKLLPEVGSLPDNVVNLEASIRVSTLESDGMVKLIKHSQASSVITSHTRLIKAWTKMVSGQARALTNSPTRMLHRRCIEWT